MKYTLSFMHNTAGYRVHAQGCKAGQDNPMNGISTFPDPFDTVQAAKDFANADESEKAGEKVKASFRVCKCAKVPA